MDKYVLEMNNITKIFPGVTALSNVTLKVKSDEIHGICGENGAGKSTLIKILSGVYSYGSFEGKVVLDNQEHQFHNIKAAEQAGIITIYQELALFKKLSIAENVFMGDAPTQYGVIQWDIMHYETQKWLTEVGMDVNPEEKVENLGVGQQQLVEIAKALSKNARILVLDEPTSALTESEVEILMDILRKLKRKGVTCIYISHKLSELIEIADRITVLRDGELIGTVDKENVDTSKLIYMMVGRTLDSLFPKDKRDRGDVAFEVRNINVYDSENVEKRIIKDVSFKACEGEILGIAGLMGSGRTELAEGIFGIRAKYRTGEILIRGKNVQITSPIQAIKKGLVYLSEDRKRYGLVIGMSVKENTTLASLKKVAKFMINENEEIHYTNKYVSYLGVKTPSIGTQVNNLSGGNQQKVVLGKWLMTEPQIFILDEVTRGIDVAAKYEIYKIMNQLVKSGVIVIMISSELPEILGLSDRIIVMHEGRINGEFMAEEATQEKIMHCATIS